MPPISDELRIIIWIISGISAAIFGLLTIILQPHLKYYFRRSIPGEEQRGRPPKSRRSNFTWGFYFVSGIMSILTAAFASSTPRIDPIATMSGDFRIAVAGFAVTDQAGRENLGIELAKGIQLRLEENLDELNPDIVISVWGPENVGSLDELNRDERASKAQQLATKIDADMIVYGIVDTTQPIWRVTPEFDILGDNFFEAEEITGQHELGSPFPLEGRDNIAGRIELGEQMTSRVQVLSKISIGLAYYAIHHYEDAYDIFKQAISLSNWDDDQGKEVIYLLLGNAAANTESIIEAEEYFNKALDIDEEYARAMVGLGSIAYIQALEPFRESEVPKDTNAELLDLSISRYKKALQAKHKPANSDIETKVHFGLGQCYFMQVYSGEKDGVDLALSEFKTVVDSYNNGENPRIRELAAEAHARIALIHDLSGNPLKGASEYEIAASLLYDYPERQSIYEKRAKELRER